MDYRRLGQSGLKVSPLCLGTMMFGGATSEADSRGIVDHARGAGINFIDTADAYNEGRSEEVTGRAIAANRHDWVLATKVANSMGPSPNQRGLSRKWVMQACEDSLRRLGTDFIDIYYLHKEDLETPLAETVRAIGELVRHGKIRHFGLGVASYSPLARGVLTAKYEPGQAPQQGTRAASGDKRIMQTEWREESLVIAQTIKAHAATRGMTPIQFAVAWVLNNRLLTAAIAGPRTLEQWQGYLAALDADFTAADEALVDSLVPAGHPSTPGYSDPAYPLEGRLSRTAI
jgi:aryl-alcohol dehydrogenase-like predicted oxidoreductase